MPDRVEGTIVFEDAQIIFRNFQGKEGPYNREGDRNFSVRLEDDELVRRLEKDGWNVKHPKPRDDDEEDNRRPHLQVSVSYRGRPPRIVMITSRNRTELTEDDIDMLDWVQFRTVDLIVNPYNWNVNGKGGVKAYLKTMFVTIEEDYLEQKYADL